MSYTVTLTNGMHGTIDIKTYDVVMSIICSIVITTYIIKNIGYYYRKQNKTKNIIDSDSDYDETNDDFTTQSQELNEYFNNLSEEDKPKKFVQNKFSGLETIFNKNLFQPIQLGDRMKFYENYTDKNIAEIDPYTAYIIRLDGRSFSKLLSSIKLDEFNSVNTPFINDFKLAMDRTTADLVKEFNASTGYNHSDEISLVFKPMNENTDDELIKEHQFNGRINKLISLTSSYASVRLSHHLRSINYEKFWIMLDRVTFDSRAVIFPDDKEMCNYFVWRSQHDCFRNFVSELCYKHFPKKSLDKLNTLQRIEKLKKERNLDIYDFNPFLRNGTFIKRELESITDDGKTYWRNKYVRFALSDFKCNSDYIDILKCKNFEEWEFHDIEFELSNTF